MRPAISKCLAEEHVSAVDSPSAPTEVPFINIFDPEFNFNSAEMTAAQDRNWYAASPVGLLVLRYTEARSPGCQGYADSLIEQKEAPPADDVKWSALRHHDPPERAAA